MPDEIKEQVRKDTTTTFRSCIQPCIPIISQGDSSITNDICFKSGMVSAYDQEVFVSIPLPKSIDIEGTVDGRVLMQVLGALPDSPITSEDFDSNIVFNAGSSKISMTKKSQDVFRAPDHAESSETSTYRFEPANTSKWIKALKKTLISCSSACLNPSLRGVWVDFEKSDEYAAIYSSDGWRITRIKMPKGSFPELVKGDGAQRVFLSLMLVQTLTNFVKDGEACDMTMVVHPTWVKFEVKGNTVFFGRQVAFDNVSAKILTALEGFTEKMKEAKFGKVPKNLTALLNSSIVVAEKVGKQKSVLLDIQNGELTISAGGNETAGRIEHGGLLLDIDNCQVRIDPELFVPALPHADEVFIDSSKAVMLRGKEDFVFALSILAA